MLDKNKVTNAVQSRENTVIPMHYTTAEKALFKRFNINVTKPHEQDY